MSEGMSRAEAEAAAVLVSERGSGDLLCSGRVEGGQEGLGSGQFGVSSPQAGVCI